MKKKSFRCSLLELQKLIRKERLYLEIKDGKGFYKFEEPNVINAIYRLSGKK